MTLLNSPDSTLGRCSLLLCLTLSSCLLVTASRLQPFSATKLDSQRPILQKDLVDKINNLQAGWQAALSTRFQNHTVQDFKRLCGALKAPVNGLDTPIKRISHPRDLVLPKNFDAREAWPHCSSINTILDQGHCGSCWAFGAVESLTDRFCINLNEEVFLSENDVLACCSQCGYGCDGGYPYNAWKYFEHTGVVTAQCDPYFDDKGCNHPGCEPAYPTPQCNKQCINNEPWNISKHFSINAYMVGPDVHDIMAEIYKNGPVEVAYDVYEDFAHYKSGVYKHLYGDGIGGHAVKLIGWGTTPEGTDYWIVANSWNRSWGEDGYFKILRGVDECGIESEVVAGMPHSKFARHASQ